MGFHWTILALLVMPCLLCVNGVRIPGGLGQSSCSRDSNVVQGSAISTANGLRYTSGFSPDAVAYGSYLDSAHTRSNFGQLHIRTSNKPSDKDQMFAAGWMEGYLTAARMWDHFRNLKSYFSYQLEADLDKPMAWLHQQDVWVRQQVEDHPGDSYWQAVGLMLDQYDGLVQGYLSRVADESSGLSGRSSTVGNMTAEDLLFLNSNGDLYDIMDLMDLPASIRKYDDLDADEMYLSLALQGKCSAIVKVVGDLSDLLLGHSTWDSYTAMTRIFKHYDLQLSHPEVASKKMSFSSYPGELFSDDDLYIMQSGLVVMETTNHIYNTSILQVLTPQSVLSWQRVRVANLLAQDGHQWVKLFRRYNSGTYNNQYMVVDMNKFIPRVALLPGLLYVVEQIPGLVKAKDMTGALSWGYWPSYNVAFFPEIYQRSGYDTFTSQQTSRGPQFTEPLRWLSYQVAPRANIFRRDQGRICSLDDLKHLMRHNNFSMDPYSTGNPTAAVCARGDLAAHGAVPKGCYDTKVTSYNLARRMEAEVVGGPTTQGLPAFEWGKQWEGFAHHGMPSRYNFTFELQSALNLPLEDGCSESGVLHAF